MPKSYRHQRYEDEGGADIEVVAGVCTLGLFPLIRYIVRKRREGKAQKEAIENLGREVAELKAELREKHGGEQ